jgi:hypothetical protein
LFEEGGKISKIRICLASSMKPSAAVINAAIVVSWRIYKLFAETQQQYL